MLALRFILDRDVINAVAFPLQWNSFFVAREGKREKMNVDVASFVFKELEGVRMQCVKCGGKGGLGRKKL